MERFDFRLCAAALLYLALVLCQSVKGDSTTQLAAPGRPASLPCPYHYEDLSPVAELSVQWRSPENRLLCHYVKHKAFQNCSEGYGLSYSPARISLTIDRVQEQDYGTHLCSVSKRRDFTDSRVQLLRPEEEVVTLVPGNGETLSAPFWTLLASFLLLVH